MQATRLVASQQNLVTDRQKFASKVSNDDHFGDAAQSGAGSLNSLAN